MVGLGKALPMRQTLCVRTLLGPRGSGLAIHRVRPIGVGHALRTDMSGGITAKPTITTAATTASAMTRGQARSGASRYADHRDGAHPGRAANGFQCRYGTQHDL